MNKPQIRIVRISNEQGGFTWGIIPGKGGVWGPDKRSVVELLKKEFPIPVPGDYEVIDVVATKPKKEESK